MGKSETFQDLSLMPPAEGQELGAGCIPNSVPQSWMGV